MEVAGLAIAVFNEVFEICLFITQTITDAAHHDKDFAKLELEFTHQQTILATFGKRFIESHIIYELEDCWVIQLKRILEELKKVVGDYARLAAKYEENYRKVLKNLEEWWSFGSTQQVGSVDRGSLRLVGIREPARPGEASDPAGTGLRNRLSRGLTRLEWALFDRKKLEDLVNDQKNWTGKLTELMKLTLLPLPRFSDNVDRLRELGRDAKTLGFSKLTNTRLLLLDPSAGDGNATEIDLKSITKSSIGPTPEGQAGISLLNAKMNDLEILVEYKQYVLGDSQMLVEITEERIKFLSRLLGVAEDGRDETQLRKNSTLHCYGYFHEPENKRYGLAFSIPQGYYPEPLSLNSALRTFIGDARPTLGQRFRMAYAIGYALMEWFLVGWVHKSISSNNVFFFQGMEGEGWDFSSPYLCGFEYARPLLESGPDGTRRLTLSNEIRHRYVFGANIYRHPARQGKPSDRFRKVHDIYAFGVLLLEIGLWKTVRELFENRSYTPDRILSILIVNARRELGHLMGQRYKNAVLFCLGIEDFGSDDEKQTKLMNAFKEEVLDACEEGQGLR